MTGEPSEEQLQSSDPEVRRQAVQRLSLFPTLNTKDRILVALADADWRVRREAISLASQVTDPEALVDELLPIVAQAKNIGLRNSAIEVLGLIGQRMAARFAAALDCADEGARKFIVEAMGKTCDPSMIEHLAALVGGSDTNAAAAAVEALVSIGGARSEAILRVHLDTPDLFLRIAIVEGLTRLGANIPWRELQPAVEDAIVRRISAELLGRTGDPEALELLLDMVVDASSQASTAAIRAVAELVVMSSTLREAMCDRWTASDEPMRKALYEALVDGDVRTREAAAFLAVLCRDETSVEAVLHAIADDVANPATLAALRGWGPGLVEPLLMLRQGDSRTRSMALQLAAELGADHHDRLPGVTLKRIRHALDSGIESPLAEMRAAAAESLKWWGDEKDCESLVAILQSGTETERAAARTALLAMLERLPDSIELAMRKVDMHGPGGAEIAQVLSSLNTPSAIAALKRGLKSNRARTRRAVVQSLAAAQGSNVAELIGYAVADEDVDVQIAAVRSLGRMCTHVAAAPLSTALASPFPAIRAEAALALGHKGADGAVDSIRALLQDHESVVVAAAVDALGLLGDDAVADAIDVAANHEDDEVFQAGLRAAATLPASSALAHLERGLAHSSWHVRIVAVDLLGGMETSAARKVLSRALSCERDAMVKHAIQACLQRES